MKKIYYIIEGYYYLLCRKIRRLNKNKRRIYDLRYEICKKCENKNTKLNICKICGCYLPAKVSCNYDLDKNGKSEEGCPIKKW